MGDWTLSLLSGLMLCPVFVSIQRAVFRSSLLYAAMAVVLTLFNTILVKAHSNAIPVFLAGAAIGVACYAAWFIEELLDDVCAALNEAGYECRKRR